MRLASNGQPDERFGSGGIAEMPANATAARMAAGADGVLLVAGRTTLGTADGIAWKLLPSGRVDATFGVVAIGADPDAASTIAADGRGACSWPGPPA